MVTGASAGMGQAAARAFAEAGASTVLVDLDEAAVRAVADELAGAGHDALALVGDVSDEAQVASAVANVVSVYGRLDAAFNNAGIKMPPPKTADTDNAIFDRVMAVNLAGVWNSLKHELIHMRKQRSAGFSVGAEDLSRDISERLPGAILAMIMRGSFPWISGGGGRP